MEHSQEILDFMRDEFRHSPDLFLQREAGAVLERMFELALRTANGTYAAFIFERSLLSSLSFPSTSDLLDSGYEGLMMGDKLELALHQLELRYMSNDCRGLELNGAHFLTGVFSMRACPLVAARLL